MLVASERGDVGLGHGERGADLALEQRLQPLLLLLGRCRTCVSTSMLPVSGAEQLHRLGAEVAAARDLGQAGVVEVRQRPSVHWVSWGRNRFHRPRDRASALRSSMTCGWPCGSPDARHLLLVDGLGRVHVGVHEVEQPRAGVPLPRSARGPS